MLSFSSVPGHLAMLPASVGPIGAPQPLFFGRIPGRFGTMTPLMLQASSVARKLDCAACSAPISPHLGYSVQAASYPGTKHSAAVSGSTSRTTRPIEISVGARARLIRPPRPYIVLL